MSPIAPITLFYLLRPLNWWLYCTSKMANEQIVVFWVVVGEVACSSCNYTSIAVAASRRGGRGVIVLHSGNSHNNSKQTHNIATICVDRNHERLKLTRKSTLVVISITLVATSRAKFKSRGFPSIVQGLAALSKGHALSALLRRLGGSLIDIKTWAMSSSTVRLRLYNPYAVIPLYRYTTR